MKQYSLLHPLHILFFVALCMVIALLLPQKTFALTCQWSNVNANNQWNDVGNWNNCGGNVPGNTDVAQFDATSNADCNMDQVGAVVGGIVLDATYPGVFTLQQNLDVGNSGTTVNGGTFNGSNFQLQTTGNITRGGGSLSTSVMNVVFNGSTNQSISGFNPSFASVTVNNSGGAGSNTVFISGTTVVDQSITLQNGVLDTATNGAIMSVGGNIDGSGGGTLNATSITFNGAANQLIFAVDTFGSIVVNKTGGAGTNTLTVQNVATLDVNGSLGMQAGVLDLATHNVNMNISDDMNNLGATLLAGPTVTFDGGSQNISGSFSFNNFTKAVTSASTLTFPGSATQTISGTLTLQGVAGNLLSIVSDAPGTQWSIAPHGSRSVQYLHVTDSNNTTGTGVDCLTGCTNGGNNTNWNFPVITNVVTTTTTSDAPRASNGGGSRGKNWVAPTWDELRAIQQQANETSSVITPTQYFSYKDETENASEEIDLSNTVFSSPLFTTIIEVALFKDVQLNEWYTNPVYNAVQSCVATGYRNEEGNLTGHFGPANEVTYAEYIRMLMNATGQEFFHNTVVLTGTEGHWAQEDFSYAHDLGWLNTFFDQEMNFLINPDDPITRNDALNLTFHAFNYGDKRQIASVTTPARFAYVNMNQILHLVNDGVFQPKSFTKDVNYAVDNWSPATELNLNDTMNRAEATTIISRAANANGVPLQCKQIKQDVTAYKVDVCKTPCTYNDKTINHLERTIVLTQQSLRRQRAWSNDTNKISAIDKQLQSLDTLKEELKKLKVTCDPTAVQTILDQLTAALKSIDGTEKTVSSLQDLKAITANVLLGGKTLKEVQDEVDEALSQEIKHDTNCEEYNRLAAKLKGQQDAAKAALSAATAAATQAQTEATAAQDAIDAIDTSITDEQTALSDMYGKLDSLEDGLNDILETIVNKTNAATGGDGAKVGTWKADAGLPSGYSAGIGNTSGFPVGKGGALYLKNSAAITEFLAQRAKFAKEIANYNKAISEQNKKIDEQSKKVSDLKAKKASQQAALAAAQAKLAAAKQQQAAAEAVISALNTAINALNAKYKDCPKKVGALKAAKAKTDAAIGEASKGSVDGFDAKYTDPTAQGLQNDGDKKLAAAGAANTAGNHEKAEQLAGQASQDYANAAKAQKASDCIKECRKALEAKRAEYNTASTAQRNALIHVDFTAPGQLIVDADHKLDQAEAALRAGNPDRAQQLCNEAKELIKKVTAAIEKAVKDREKALKEQLNKDGDNDRDVRDDTPVLVQTHELVSELNDALKAAIDAFGDTKEAAELLKRLIELGEKYGIKIEFKKGDKTADKIKAALDLFGGRMGNAADATAEVQAETQKMQDELKKILDETLFKYLRDKLGKQLTEAAAKFAARKLGVAIAGPLSAVFGEAWDFGSAVGDAMVETLLQARDDIFKNHTAGINLCEGGQPVYAINRKIDTHVQIIKVGEGNKQTQVSSEDGYVEMTYNKESRGTETVKIKSNKSASTKPKMATRLPEGPENDKVFVGGKQAEVLEKVVSVTRECTKDADGKACLLIKVNVRYYVRG